eukprot:g33740.t1
MLDRNALLFIGLQFGSRFANSFLVTAARYELLEDLAIINGWDLTCDKIGRYLAPFAYAVVSSSHGFNFAVLLSCLMYALMSVLRMMVTVLEPASRRETKNGASQPTVAQKLGGLLQQVVDGVTSLRRDKVLQLLIINTLVTNVFLYPLNSVHFPVLFKQVAEREKSELDRTVVDDLLHQVMLALDIKRNGGFDGTGPVQALSLGGVAGPFLSNAMIYMLESYSTNHKVCQLWVGVNFGIVGQISTMALLAGMRLLSSSFGSGSLVFNLASALKHLVSPQLDGFLVASKVGAWIVTISVNNIVTTYFNSISQERLQQKERGRFIANIMTIFNLGSICGSLLFGWVLSAHENSVTGSVNLLLCGLMIKIILLACDLERESFVPQTSVTCRCCCGGKEKVPSQVVLDHIPTEAKASACGDSSLHVPSMAAVSRKRKADPDEPPELQTRTYTAQRVLGKGSFGVVYQAQVLETGETVAIKSIKMQEKDREVQILKELHGHPNIVCLHGAFLSDEGTAGSGTRLNLVIKHYSQLDGKKIEPYYIKLYQFQLMRGLAFIHGRGIVHCDLKPQNLLLDGKSHTLKICDFGTAKRMIFGEQQRSYMVSRYYRAPELILGATSYTTGVDLWSAGCVFAELILGQPLFTGKENGRSIH